MTTTAQEVDVKQMTKTERRELRRIVSRRFRLLRDQLHRRERELDHAVRAQIREEKKATIQAIEDALVPLIERQNELAADFAKVHKMAAKKGATLHRVGVSPANLEELRATYGEIVNVVKHDEVSARTKAVRESAGWSRLNLNEMEWALDEQLAIGELESGSAQEFLSALPTVDTLLPLPAGISLPEIESGIDF